MVETTRPSGRNTDDTVTASFSSPPPLWRRSSTTPVAPFLSSFLTAVLTSSPEPDVKPASRTHAIFLPSLRSTSDCTIGMSTLARSSVTRRPSRSLSLTVEPAGPLISAVDSSEVLPASERPLTSTMMSPTFSPPSLAGESS